MPHPKLTAGDRRQIEELISRIERLKTLGEFTDSEISRGVDVGQTSVSAWFRERNVPLGQYLARLPRALSRPNRRVNGHWLLTGEGEPFLPEAGETEHEGYLRGQHAALLQIEEAVAKARQKLRPERPGRRRSEGRARSEP